MRVKSMAAALIGTATVPARREGSASPRRDETKFKKRFRPQFPDHSYDTLQLALGRITDAAWDA